MVKLCQSTGFLRMTLSATVVGYKFSCVGHVFRLFSCIWSHLEIRGNGNLWGVIESKAATLDHGAPALVHRHVVFVPIDLLFVWLKLLHELGNMLFFLLNRLLGRHSCLLSFQLRCNLVDGFRGLKQVLKNLFTCFVAYCLVTARLRDELLGILNLVMFSDNVVNLYNVFGLLNALLARVCRNMINTSFGVI